MNGTITDTLNINGIINNNIELNAKLDNNQIKGTISNNNKIKGVIRTGITVNGTINNCNSLIAKLETSSISYPNYDGDYIVIPKTIEQLLETKNKITRDDITVKEIPYSEVANEYGNTVTIA
jgi:hypothetical protein